MSCHYRCCARLKKKLRENNFRFSRPRRLGLFKLVPARVQLFRSLPSPLKGFLPFPPVKPNEPISSAEGKKSRDDADREKNIGKLVLKMEQSGNLSNNTSPD